MRLIVFLGVLAPLVSIARPRTAAACSPPICWPGHFVPAQGATIPANAPGLYWQPMSSQVPGADPHNVRLTSTTHPDTPLAFTSTLLADGDYLIAPVVPLVVGASYALTDTSVCSGTGETGPSVTFTVGPAAPMPGALSVMSGAQNYGQIDVATASGSCSAQALARTVDVDFAGPAAIEPWLPLLHFATSVDGTAWSPTASINDRLEPGASWRGRGHDQIYHVCSTGDSTLRPGVALGTHQVTMTARLPGTTIELTSAPVEIELACATDNPGDGWGDVEHPPAHGGCSAGGSGAMTWIVAGFVAVLITLRRRQ